MTIWNLAMWLGAALLAGLVAAPYLLYPALVRLRRRVEASAADAEARPVARLSVLIPACNEEAELKAKLEGSLALASEVPDLEIIVCSDGSTDGTEAIARSFESRGVKLIRNARRLGKPSTLNYLVEESTGELLLLTDASARLAPDALRRLLDAMAAPSVGLACPRYAVKASEGEASAESGYWGREAMLRKAESERGLLIGVSGAAYLVRRELVPTLEDDTVNDDFVIPLAVRRAGAEVAFVGEAVVEDAPTASLRTLYRRWVRIAWGNYQMLWRNRDLLVPGHALALPMWRKALKTAGPLLLLVIAGLLVAMAANQLGAAGAVTVALSGLAVAGLILAAPTVPGLPKGPRRVANALRYGLLAQLAYLEGAVRSLIGYRKGLWHRPEGTRPESWPIPPRSVRATKRLFDILAALVGLMLAAPVMVIIAIAIKLDSRGPIFYRQERTLWGRDGTPRGFSMLKFRTMAQDAEAKTGPVWAGKNDPRVTRLGHFLRTHRLDEVPQLVNILLGEMTLVGPRPERPSIVASLAQQIPGYAERLSVVRPGITGWAQVQCGYDTSLDQVRDKVMHDLAYVAHLYRFTTYARMELRVLFRTFGVVWNGKGAQ